MNFYIIDHCGKLYCFKTLHEAEAKVEKFKRNGEKDVTIIFAKEVVTK